MTCALSGPAIPVFALALAVAVAPGCACHPAPAAEHPEEPSQISLSGVKLHSFKGSQEVGFGRADHVQYQRTSTAFTATSADLTLIADAGTRVVLHAPTLTGFANSPLLGASGGVTARSSDGAVATAPSAHFDTAASVATGEQGIRLNGPAYEVSSERFRLDLGAEEYLFEDNVESRYGGQR